MDVLKEENEKILDIEKVLKKKYVYKCEHGISKYICKECGGSLL